MEEGGSVSQEAVYIKQEHHWDSEDEAPLRPEARVTLLPQQTYVKEETEFHPSCSDDASAAWTQLYADHVVKDELVLGPERPHRPQLTCIASEAITNKNVINDNENGAAIEPIKTEDGLDSSEKRNKKDVEKYQDIRKHLKNVRNILRYSNATPIRRHTGIRYHCAFCDVQRKLPRDLKQHTLKHHSDNSQINTFMKGERIYSFAPKLDLTSLHCKLCDTQMYELEQLLVHLKDDHKKEIYTDLNNHIIPLKFNSETLKCAVCDEEFAYFKKLQEHTSVHYRNFLCNICSAPFMSKFSLQRHKSQHKQGEFECCMCERVFDTKLKKNLHEKFFHLSDYRRSKCPYCAEKFLSHDRRMQHMAEVHGERTVKLNCKSCSMAFNSQRTLTRHMKRAHLMQRTHPCHLCDKSFFDKRGLTHHMPKHTGIKEYICDICNKAYGRKNTLREHMRIHADDRRFKCGTCGQAFIQKTSLKTHMLKKHGEALV